MKDLGIDFKTRLFEEKDLPEVMRINLTCLPENYSDSYFLEIYQNFPKSFIVATINEKVIGYIMCRIEIGFSDLKRFKIGRKGHIISLAVVAEHREQGIASVLLSMVLKNISEYNVDECYLEVRVGNKSATDLYKRYDFETLRTIRGYYRDGEDAYVMSKALV
ncbi:ribosomal protein S18-alanine N-acetyltransferase [Candidatus Bathyarchaeota archaeon]|nr:ribosomal protein S18-alanine N-acetyltransferase [Candidatus Bathyarchaeota archaeon]